MTLAGAVVQLRRLAAMDEDDLKLVIFSVPMRSLVVSALAAVERALAGRDGAVAASDRSFVISKNVARRLAFRVPRH